MRILALTRYDASGPSSRYRTYQYLPLLRDSGLEIAVEPLFDRAYIRDLFGSGERSRARVLRAAMRRLRVLATSWKYDVIWIEKELLPWAPPLLESLLARSGARLVVDYDDAVFHRYDKHGSALVRAVLGRKIDRVMSLATLVIAGNDYLARRAREAGARWVEVLPTVIDLERYPPPAPAPERAGPFTIGWIGSPTTQVYLQSIAPALATFCAGVPARVVAVGARPGFALPGVPLEVVPWSEQTEVASLRAFDVGIMPLPDSPFERGKCGLKLVQYMGCGLPVIASPVGVNSSLIREGANGFLASTPEQWVATFHQLASSCELRHVLGSAGRQMVEKDLSVAGCAPRLAQLLRRAATLGA